MKLSNNTIAQIIIWVAVVIFHFTAIGMDAVLMTPLVVMVILLLIKRDKLLAQREELLDLLSDIITEFKSKENEDETQTHPQKNS